MNRVSVFIITTSVLLLVPACKRKAPAAKEPPAAKQSEGSAKQEDNKSGDTSAHPEGHVHEEVDLGSAAVGEMTVEFAQGHGKVAAGKEGHLVVKLPYNDNGATTVRAWIGTEDRTLSYVGKAEYAAGHDDYDVHAIAPDPLPDKAMWWVEIEKPDGTTAVGSIKLLK